MATNPITITADMTVQTLIDEGVVTLTQLQAYANAKASGGRGASATDRTAFADEVFAIMCENPQQAWKNGILLKTWFPNGKEQDADLEKLRVKKHQAISRALADLTADGRLVKDRSGDSASTTFYKVVESAIPAQADEAPADETDDGTESEA